MEFGQLITLIIGGSGVIGFVGTVYSVRKNSSSAAASTEVEQAAQESADWASFSARIQGHLDYQDKQIQALRTEIRDLQQDRQDDAAYIKLLQRQIYLNVGPPPLGPGDNLPGDQVGG